MSRVPLADSVEAKAVWYAVHTRSRHERLVRDLLAARACYVFLPERMIWGCRRDRRKQISVPLFPGYLFVSPDGRSEHLRDVLYTRGVVRILGVNGRPQPVPLQEVESLQVLVESGELLRSLAYLVPGTRVRVLEGLLAGVEGVLLRYGKKSQLVVSIELMQRAVAVELAEWQFEKVGDR